MADNLDNAVRAIRELVAIFRTERMVYLAITIISLVFLIATAGWLIVNSKSQEDSIAVIGLFTSSGGIMYSSGRLLKMWSEALELIQRSMEKE